MTARCLRNIAALSFAIPVAVAGAAVAHVSGSPGASSAYLAGYTSQLMGSGSIESITVPEFTCPQGVDTRVAFGIADQGPDDPQPVVRAAVDAVCEVEGGVVTYGTEVAVPGKSLVSTIVSPGDVLSFRITYRKHHQVVASVIDETHPQGSVTLSGTSEKAALHFGALPIVEGDTLLAAPDFGQVDVVGAMAAGSPLTRRTTVRYQRVHDGQPDILATGLQKPPSGSFSLVSGGD
jgi:hypothetical protein